MMLQDRGQKVRVHRDGTAMDQPVCGVEVLPPCINVMVYIFISVDTCLYDEVKARHERLEVAKAWLQGLPASLGGRGGAGRGVWGVVQGVGRGGEDSCLYFLIKS